MGTVDDSSMLATSVRTGGRGLGVVRSVLEWIVDPLRYLWVRRAIIYRLYMLELRANTAGTMVGNFWTFLYPLIYFFSYIFLFVFVLKVNFKGLGTLEYITLILVGLAPALTFAQAIAGGVGSIVANSGLLKGTLIDIEAIPVRYVVGTQPTLLTGLAIALVYLIATGHVGWTTILVLPIWALQTLWTIGLLWVLAPINVYFRDLGQVVSALITPLVMMSPVAYPVSDAPAAIQALLWFNPFFYIIKCYQDVLIFLRIPDLPVLAAFIALSIGFLMVGYRIVVRAKAALIDSM
jgi:lipopolysaccharide transport system permease protein